jgi:cardiolipin synthase
MKLKFNGPQLLRSRFDLSITKALTSIFIGVAALTSSVEAFPIRVSEAPATNLELTLEAIRSAQKSLQVNIYELSSESIGAALIERVQAGVHLVLLQEGQPVGGFTDAARKIQDQLVSAVRASSVGGAILEMRSIQVSKTKQTQRRFRFNHGKYIIVDHEKLLVGSENYSNSGNPERSVKGNRGWEVLLTEPSIVKKYEDVFARDIELSHGDVIDRTELRGPCSKQWTACETQVGGVRPYYRTVDWSDQLLGQLRGPIDPKNPPFAPWISPLSLEADAAAAIFAPETAAHDLLHLVHEAKRTLDLQQMTFDSKWGADGELSPLVRAVVKAARKGVRVRVLVNDDAVFDHPGKPASRKNLKTAQLLNSIAKNEKLSLEARVANLSKMGISYIHNKGVLVDSQLTLVSSINWNRNSVTNNRETAVLIQGTEVFNHYETLFEDDWKRSEGKGQWIPPSDCPRQPNEPIDPPDPDQDGECVQVPLID